MISTYSHADIFKVLVIHSKVGELVYSDFIWANLI